MQSVTIGNNQAGQRLDKFLHKYLPYAGTGFLYKMLRKKNITLNGKKADGNEILSFNDTISFYFSDETFAKFAGSTITPNGQKNQKKSREAFGTEEYLKAYKTLHGIEIEQQEHMKSEKLSSIFGLSKAVGGFVPVVSQVLGIADVGKSIHNVYNAFFKDSDDVIAHHVNNSDNILAN